VERAELARERAASAVGADERVERDRADAEVPAPERLQPLLDLVELEEAVAAAGLSPFIPRASVQRPLRGFARASRAASELS
jgi:hypothetical protein